MARGLVVVIATHGRASMLERTLRSLAACERPAMYRETLIVENGSPGRAQELCATYASSLRTRYLHEPAPNKAAALNAAIWTAGESLLCFADDDIRLHSRTLAAYAAAAEGVDGGRFFGGPFGVDYEEPPPAWLLPYMPASATGWKLEDETAGVSRGIFLGFNWAAFAGDLRRLGGFNISLGPGERTLASVGDESDMQDRLLQNGITAQYVPDAWVWHYVPRAKSTVQWTLERRYQSSLSTALRREAYGQVARRRSKLVPRWIATPLHLLVAAITLDSRRAFLARYWDSHERGQCEAERILRQRTPA